MFIVFDGSNERGLEKAAQWKDDIDNTTKLPSGENIPAVLLRNKCDLIASNTPEIRGKIDAFVKEKGFLGWFDTSAKSNIDIDKAITFMTEYLIKHQDIRLDEVSYWALFYL